MELLIYKRLLAGPLRYQYDGNAARAVTPRLAWFRWTLRKTIHDPKTA